MANVITKKGVGVVGNIVMEPGEDCASNIDGAVWEGGAKCCGEVLKGGDRGAGEVGGSCNVIRQAEVAADKTVRGEERGWTGGSW